MAALSAAAHIGKGARAVLTDDAFKFGGNLIYSLIPGDTLKSISDLLQRVLKAVGVVLVIGDVHAFAAKIALTFSVGFIRLHFDDAVIFYLYFQPAVLAAEHTSGFMYCSHE
jgi:hypothetical protein